MLPRTRFPFFSGNYTEKFLHEAVLELKSGLSRMFSDSDIGLPVIRSNNIKDYCLDFNDLKYWFEEDTQGAKTSNYHLRDGDILVNFINSQAQIGKSAIYQNALNRDCIYTTNILSLRINKEYSSRFIFFFFQTKKYNDFIQSITKPAVNQASFTTKDFRKMKIFFPDFTEQTKIADFLSSVDEKITLLNKQYELLCQYKKSMMQKIFCQKFRFKCENGKDYPEWETTELNEIASKVNKKNRDNSVSTVLTNSATQGIVSQQSYFEREIVTESNLTGYYVVNVGDFVYNPRISATAPVGPIKMNELSKGIMSPLYTVFRFNQGSLKFYQYFFESSVWHDYMKSVANSGARHDRMNISGADFLALPIPQPIEKEQTKIANFLSAIDDKITIKKAELDKLKTWKQGLLQQMFV
ncbi:TPA: restriction endonuclease subunit S [Yersinia enterocolitica]|uniref:restriction endonuclease subunit S n=1 Tax=unclassified Citrobacter freundii complex TaxID=2816438 RepID=UPI0011AF46C7|nr:MULTISPECIES: restriction endonuclease subunit S [unclassified Citrobacter freundii complex]EKN3733234.1 restriction endonuclease subunit S [Yersinia enterocolitica]EKN5983306.1 restriction endonuclease subunit S [Yersinia enterocolitica]EKN5987598.1 restriction endonuclease subunit S [Yersinia enterocolitica]EKN6168304.1 restriction endonuclease subunit S [Yersinia enterocolitica]EKN6398449.1 restriction endonuclease subunit S [Yersinia enterocolitica]